MQAAGLSKFLAGMHYLWNYKFCVRSVDKSFESIVKFKHASFKCCCNLNRAKLEEESKHLKTSHE